MTRPHRAAVGIRRLLDGELPRSPVALGAVAVAFLLLVAMTAAAALVGGMVVYDTAQVASLAVRNETDNRVTVSFGGENGYGEIPARSTRRVKAAWVFRFGFHPTDVSIGVWDATSRFKLIAGSHCVWSDAKSHEPVVVRDNGISCKDVPIRLPGSER